MKAKNLVLVFLLALSWVGPAFCADSDATGGRPFIGVLLDSTPLPALLIKHLGLSPDQGIRIKNVHRGGPADKAGLERDDIIIGLEGEDVVDYETFVDDIREAGVGAEVSVEIVHLGSRKTVELTLEALKDFDLKYPPEPAIVQSWRPGKVFRLRPGDENWMEMLQDRLNTDFDVNIKRFFNELHTYHHSNGEDYSITIEGNPDDDDSTITVQSGDNEYKTTIGEIEKLPEKYRESAEQAVKNAREAAKEERIEIRSKRIPWQMPDDWKSYFDKMKPYRDLRVPPFERGGEIFDRIQKQMKELQRRLDRLEKRQQEQRDSQEPEKEESQDRQKPLPSGEGGQRRV